MEGLSFIEQFEKKRSEKNDVFLKYCLTKNPFTPFSIETAKESLVDRKQAKEQFILNFNRLIDGEILHIFIRGKRGFGKSHLLTYFYQEIKEAHKKIGITEPLFFDSTSKVRKWLRENPSNDQVKYFFIDDASLGLMFGDDGYLYQVYKSENIRTINCWQESTDITMPFQIKPSDITEDFEDIEICALEKTDEIELLKKRVELSSKSKAAASFFDESFFKEISKISHGNPRLLLKNASNCFLDNLGLTEKFTSKAVSAYITKHGMKTTLQLEELIKHLTSAQEKVLASIPAIHNVKNKTECSLIEIAKLLDITKPAVLNSLHPLIEGGFVKARDGQGLQKFYSIQDGYKEFVEERFKDTIKALEAKQSQKISKVLNSTT